MAVGRRGLSLISLGVKQPWRPPHPTVPHRCYGCAAVVSATHPQDLRSARGQVRQTMCGDLALRSAKCHFFDRRDAGRRAFHSTARASKRDFYEVLGVPRGADASEVKKKYFQLAKKYHPDTNQDNPDAKKKFQEITEAYEVLGNTEKRERYDQFGHAGVDPGMGAGGTGGPDPFAGFGGFGGPGAGAGGFRTNIDPNDLFEQLFGAGMGGQRRPRGPRPGQDLQIRLELSFLEAAFGTRKSVPVTYIVLEGQQRKRNTRNVEVDIPAGVENGIVLQMPQMGAEGDKGAPRGDLYVQLSVAEDPYFEREGPDLHVEAMVGLAEVRSE
ncbi:unnamed protein product [Discosporangium mesarthrocarpum]